MAQQTGKTIASTEQAPQGEHGVFPPFDSQTYPSQLLWLTLTFVALTQSARHTHRHGRDLGVS